MNHPNPELVFRCRACGCLFRSDNYKRMYPAALADCPNCKAKVPYIRRLK